MIPVSVSDILKILDQIPAWKAVVGLPKRIAELERRIGELETGKAILSAPAKVPEARICPMCEGTMKVTSEIPHMHFGIMGVKVHKMKCEGCGNVTERDFDPGKGYK